MVSFYKEMKYNLKDAYTVSILGSILTNRYTKSIREEQGGTYGVGVSGGASREPVNSYGVNMQFDCDPSKAAELKPLLYVEIDKIIKDGVTLLDCSLKLGSYNTPAGEQMFGANVPGNVVKNDTFLLKYDLVQADDGHMYFDNGRVLVTHSNSEYEYWMPATAEVTLTPCNNAPWASLPVKQVLAAGFGKYKMDGFTTERIGDMDTEENMPWLLL